MPHPRLVISRCLELDHCRYDGATVHSDLVLRLMPHVDLLPVCMEADMGLGVPRDPVRIVRRQGEDRLVQPATGMDLTEEALRFTRDHLLKLHDVDGFLLKSRSPSCGVKDVLIYPPEEGRAAITKKASGIFAREVLRTFPRLPVEDEARLLEPRPVDHFLTRIFTGARFRQARRGGTAKDLINFHAAHELLLMTYNLENTRRLGLMAASSAPKEERFRNYEDLLHATLRRPPGRRSLEKVLMHVMYQFSDRLPASEKEHLLQGLERFAEGTAPLSAPLLLLRSWSLRHGENCLQGQAILEPYPVELMEYLWQEPCTSKDR